MIDDNDLIHFFIGENKICFPDEEFIFKMDFPRCMIRYKLSDGYFSGYDEFFNNIAEVQWIDGEIPSQLEQSTILTNAWNFLALEEKRLESDLEDF